MTLPGDLVQVKGRDEGGWQGAELNVSLPKCWPRRPLPWSRWHMALAPLGRGKPPSCPLAGSARLEGHGLSPQAV